MAQYSVLLFGKGVLGKVYLGVSLQLDFELLKDRVLGFSQGTEPIGTVSICLSVYLPTHLPT